MHEGDEILYKGQKFETKSELRPAIRLYSVMWHREIEVASSDKERDIVRCKLKHKANRCNWRLHASINKQELWQIKIFMQPHICNHHTPIKDHKQLTSALVGGLVLDIVRADLAIKPVTIIETVKMKYEYSISYWKSWHVKQHALRFLFGGW